jgi:subtilisin family serine protease
LFSGRLPTHSTISVVEKSSASNFGQSAIDVAGPGGDFNGNLAASTVISPCSTRSLVIPGCQVGGFYLFLQGTSMATPHAARRGGSD